MNRWALCGLLLLGVMFFFTGSRIPAQEKEKTVGLPSLLVAAAILRCGMRWTFALGSSLILAGALWLCLVATRPWHYLLGFGVLVGTGISFGTIVPAATAVTRWFVRYRGRAMAVTLSASGFAGFFGAPLINGILAATGGKWRLAWLVVSVVTILSGILALLFVKERPEDLGQVADGRNHPDQIHEPHIRFFAGDHIPVEHAPGA
jgi:MFS family permease